MKVIFSDKTKEDFKKYVEYLKGIRKSDGHKYQKYELDGMSKSLKKNITKGLENKTNHIDSIFPDGYEYSHKNYKMYVDKESHHVIFYKVNSNNNTIKVGKCIHSTELKKDLEERGIKPLENVDKSLLDDLEEVYKEDEVKNKKGPEDDQGKEEMVYDEETGKDVKHIVYTGPQGGRYYKNNKGEKVYVDERMAPISLKTTLLKSKMVSLSEYMKKIPKLVG